VSPDLTADRWPGPTNFLGHVIDDLAIGSQPAERQTDKTYFRRAERFKLHFKHSSFS